MKKEGICSAGEIAPNIEKSALISQMRIEACAYWRIRCFFHNVRRT